jgi:hypothetical protein
MIPYELDPSLHGAEPAPPLLDDGFSPRPEPTPAEEACVTPSGNAGADVRPQPAA